MTTSQTRFTSSCLDTPCTIYTAYLNDRFWEKYFDFQKKANKASACNCNYNFHIYAVKICVLLFIKNDEFDAKKPARQLDIMFVYVLLSPL